MDKETFVQNIRTKYPEYKNIDTNTLYNKIIEKYPVYKSQIKEPSFTDRVKSDISNAGNTISDAIQGQGQFAGQNAIQRGFKAAETGLSVPLQTASEALPEAGRKALGAIGEGISKVPGIIGGAIGNSKTLQDAVMNHPDATNAIETGLNVASSAGNIANNILAADGVQRFEKGSKQLAGKAGDVIKTGAEKTTAAVKNVTGELVPTTDRIVNHQVTKALDLTQGDVKNINLSTGNEVGQFIADKNLIRSNKVETTKAINDFFKENHAQVRSEIGKVTKIYSDGDVPRFKQALNEINKQVSDTPGLEVAGAEIKDLLKKDTFTLTDVQRAKELLDEHFNLYKMTGDVKEGVTKQGLANVRQDLRQFIEKQVKENTGADISELNNNVATSRGIANAIEERSTRGLTAANIKRGDFAAAGLGFFVGGPAGAIALVTLEKIASSPAMRLKIARVLDGFSDAKKLKIRNALEKGELPTEIKSVVNQSDVSSSSQTSKNINTKNAVISPKSTPKATGKSSFIQRIKDTPNKQGGAINFEKIAKSIDNGDKNIMLDFIEGKNLGKGNDLAREMNLDSTFGTTAAIKKDFQTILELERQNMKKKMGL